MHGGAVNLPSAAAAETLFEELLELCVEDGVDDGVEGAVDVAQPGDGAHQAGRDVARQAQGARRMDDKERRPAEQEATCNDSMNQLSWLPQTSLTPTLLSHANLAEQMFIKMFIDNKLQYL